MKKTRRVSFVLGGPHERSVSVVFRHLPLFYSMKYRRLRDERRELGLYLPVELEETLGLPRGWCYDNKQMFPATHKHGARMCFNEADLAAIRKYISKPRPASSTIRRDQLASEGWFSIKSAAKHCGIPHITWQSNVMKGVVPRPTHRIGTTWHYSRQEAEAIAAKLRAKKTPAGCLTLRELAGRFGLSPQGLQHYLRQWPDIGTRVHPRRRYYSQADADEVAKRMASYKPGERIKPEGLLTTNEVAARLGIDLMSFRNRLYYYKPDCGVRRAGRRYFQPEDVAVLRKVFGLPPPLVKML